MSDLENLLKNKYNISDKEVQQASDNLIGFFEILHKIDVRLKKEQEIVSNSIKEENQSKAYQSKKNKNHIHQSQNKQSKNRKNKQSKQLSEKANV